MKKLLIIASLILVVSPLAGQTLSGTISGPTGNAIPYGTIYIEQLKQGTVANDEGYFSISVPAGSYRVTFQSMGFTPETRVIVIDNNSAPLAVTLQLQFYTIPEVKVMATGEDPAYSIMRKAIGLARYNLNRVQSYKADVYLKGNLIMTNIPRVMRKSFRFNDTQIKVGDRFIMESYNNIEFTAPDKYVQTVISQRTNFPSTGSSISPMDFIKSSFYQPNLGTMTISPLSPDAMSHYKFMYQGANKEGDYLINKIEVTPKRKSQQLWEGTIYIIEDLWCIHSLSLTNESLAGLISVDQIYTEVDFGIWLPVTHQFDIDLSMLGIKGFAGYGGSVKYLDVKPDNSLPVPESVALYMSTIPEIREETDAASKNRAEMESILSKNDISNREMARLGRLMEKEITSGNKEEKPSLEIIDKTTYIIQEDAARKDSSFWASIRPIPLSKEEIPVVIASDTSGNIKPNLNRTLTIAVGTSAKQDSTEEKKKRSLTLMNIMRGKTWTTEEGFRFGMDGLARLNRSGFNPVDGFYYSTSFRISKDWEKSTLAFYPVVGYNFGRESFSWTVNSTLSFNMMMQEQIYLRTGSSSKDLNGSGGINKDINSFTSLFLKRNYLKLYESNWITLGHRIELFNGFYLVTEGSYENRVNLPNSTDYSFFNKDRAYDPNFPENKYINDGLLPEGNRLFDSHVNYEFKTTISYTPQQRYRIVNDRKIPSSSVYPTFSTTWRHGINDDNLIRGSFDHIEGSVVYRSNTGTFTAYRALLRGGFFINSQNLTFKDFKHINNQPLPVSFALPEDAFLLKPFYSMSTPNSYVEFHGRYTNPYILLKLLPGLSNTLIRENINLSLFQTNGSQPYYEIGYSLSELFLLAELGVYTGFEGLEFYGVGLRLSLRIN